MLYLPTFIIGYILGFGLRAKKFSIIFSIVAPIIGMVVYWIIYSFISAGYIHEITFSVLNLITVGGFFGSGMGLITFYFLSKSDGYLRSKFIDYFGKFAIPLVSIPFALLLFWTYFQWDFEIRKELPDKIPLFTFSSFREDKVEGLSGYHSRAYEFKFEDYKSVADCMMTTKDEMLKDDFFKRVGLPFKVFDLIEGNEDICVINNSDLMNGRMLITRENGAIFIAWYRD